MIVLGNIYWACANHAGFLPPPQEAGIVEYAAFAHALCLDTLRELVAIVDEWDPTRQRIVESCLVSSAVDFFEAQRLGKSRGDLYDIYAVLHGLLTDPMGEGT